MSKKKDQRGIGIGQSFDEALALASLFLGMSTFDEHADLPADGRQHLLERLVDLQRSPAEEHHDADRLAVLAIGKPTAVRKPARAASSNRGQLSCCRARRSKRAGPWPRPDLEYPRRDRM